MTDSHLYIGCSAAQDALGKTIRVFEGAPVNHAFLAWQDEHLGWLALGANANGITQDSWANFTKDRYVPALWRPKEPPDLWTGLNLLKDDLNAKYSYLGLVNMSVVEIAARLFHHHMRNVMGDAFSHRLFCSQFAVEVIRRSGYPFAGEQAADTIDPGQLMHLLARDLRFVQIAEVPK